MQNSPPAVRSLATVRRFSLPGIVFWGWMVSVPLVAADPGRAELPLGVSALWRSPVAKVEVLNTTNRGGTAVADVVLPLARGLVFDVPLLVTDQGMLCQARPMGARWPGGSLRYARVDLPVRVAPGERRTVELFLGTGVPPDFELHPDVLAGLSGFRMAFAAAGSLVEFTEVELVEHGHLVANGRMRLRIPNSSLWAELHLLGYSKLGHLRFYLAWGNSNPHTQTLSEDPGEVSFQVLGAQLLVEEHAAKVLAERVLSGGQGKAVVLHRGGLVGDGQAQCFEGSLVFSGQAPRVRALAHGWAESRAFGPFGELFPQLPMSAKDWGSLLARGDTEQLDDPWAPAFFGCNPDPANTGGQRDFGTIVMRHDLVAADPSRLKAIARSVLQEYCRPTHFRESDVSPVTTRAHPQLITLRGRPHFQAATWVDTLGKPRRYLGRDEVAQDPDGRAFRGHDAEHLSINYLCAFALATGDRAALLECDHQAELWLSRFTVNSGTFNDTPGPSRGVGRGLLAGCWLWLVTGREDLAARIMQRTRQIGLKLRESKTEPWAKVPGVLSPRYSAFRGHYWPPWEEALAVTGLAAVFTLSRDPEVGELVQIMSSTIVRHGIGATAVGWRVGYQIPFEKPGGQPYESAFDASFASDQAAGTGLTVWSLPAVIMASLYPRDGATKLAADYLLSDLLSDPHILGEERILEWLAAIPW